MYVGRSGEELRQLIADNKLTTAQMTECEILELLDIEYAALEADGSHDTTLINKCNEALATFDDFIAAQSKFESTFDVASAVDKAVSSINTVASRKKVKYVRMNRRMASVFVAAAIMTLLACVAVVAFFDPFEMFGFSIHDVASLNAGESIGNESITIDVNYSKSFDTLAQLEKDSGTDLLLPSQQYKPTEMLIIDEEHASYALMLFYSEDGAKISYEVYLDYDGIMPYDPSYFADGEFQTSQYLGNPIYYITSNKQCSVTAVFYDSDMPCVVQANTKEQIDSFISTLTREN